MEEESIRKDEKSKARSKTPFIVIFIWICAVLQFVATTFINYVELTPYKNEINLWEIQYAENQAEQEKLEKQGIIGFDLSKAAPELLNNKFNAESKYNAAIRNMVKNVGISIVVAALLICVGTMTKNSYRNKN